MQPTLRALIPDAPEILCQLLERSRGPVQAPIRAEIFGPQRFAQHGRSLAQTHRATRSSLRTGNFFPRIKNNLSTLREAHQYIGVQASTGYDISPAAEWLLDNFHLIEAQLNEIKAGLPRSYFTTLPKLLDEPLAGLPRVYGVAWAFVAHTDGAFDAAMLVQFLCAYQEVRELNLSEMWALPTTLRVVLIENLRRLAVRVATNKAAREVANRCVDQIDALPLRTVEDLLDLLNARGLGRVFLVQMAQRLQDFGAAAATPEQVRVQEWLHTALPDLAAVQLQQGADQAADNLSMSNAITALRAIGDADWPELIAQSSPLMHLMLGAPVFAAEDTSTRDQSLHAIERLAKRSHQSELTVARKLLDLMATSNDAASSATAHWLEGSGRPALWTALGLPSQQALNWSFWSAHLRLPTYLGVILGSGVSLLWVLQRHSTEHVVSPTWLVLALALFPASEAVIAVVHRLISESLKPRHLPRLVFAEGIPPEHGVMVVIPGMLTSAASTQALVNRLELHYLANPEPHAQFALLTDWADADTPGTASDAACLASATLGIQGLNARYPRTALEMSGMSAAPRFILLHRARLFSPSEQRWIGWERKRGKLELLIAALAQGSSSAFLDLGDNSRMATGVPYIVTLDSDTQLPPGKLRELVGVAAHPHNLPRLDASGRQVVSGYGILQPRVATPLPAVKEFTLYHWLFAGQCGIDPYSAASSEIYQDVFAEGTFTGKGLLNVQAIHAVLSNRLPEGQVLSHDLLEGAIARCAAVSDIMVLEDAPFHADVAASRVHRWTRGDWQLWPFLLAPTRYGLSAINRWKMLDNLRRSLVAPMSLGLFLASLAGWVLSPWLALSLVLAAFSAGPLMGALAGLAPSRDDRAMGHFYRAALTDLARALCCGLWLLAQLLQQSLLALDAVGRALYRLTVSRRHLLQWTTAEVAQAQAKTTLSAVLRQHRSEPLVALLLWAALLWAGAPTPWLAGALCLLWAGAPLWTWLVSRTYPVDAETQLTTPEQTYLAGIARDTWRYFERCVGPDDRHLPPDNLQTSPYDMVAHRTSPTNIGLYLLSVACARQFGWIGTHELLTRLEATLATLGTLERHRGHFLNWYDTQNGQPLLPSYVSTVDSGNLSGHLLAVAQACRELALAPFDDRAAAQAIEVSRQRLAPLLKVRATLTAPQREELRWLLQDHRATLVSARLDQEAKTSDAPNTGLRLQTLAKALELLAWQPDFSFLYSARRHLFHIGYRVAEQQRDAGFYDLLASESRLTSLLAIAKGDVPVRHWGALGRPFFAVGNAAGLRSWTGSMFEYLMPAAVLMEPYGSVLHEAGHAALREHMVYAKSQGVPWGISESAYAASDATLAYQYAPHGVPRLALRRTPADELVIAPYATALAAQVSPHCANLNFKILEALKARGRYGFIEALDYSTAGRTGSEAFTPVETFMAHHQGMSIVALANVLLQGCAQRWGMANAHVQAVSSLLHERVPREIPVLQELPQAIQTPLQRRHVPALLRALAPGDSAIEPTQVLSNGRYSVLLRANGAGNSRWGQTGISRWRDDALRDEHGSFFYLRWAGQPQAYSLTQHPAPDPAARYHSVFHADRVCFDAHWSVLQAHTTVWISPEDDIEFRQVELSNLSERTLEVELMSAFDVTLSDPRADEAHPAFTNLFVTAQWLASHQALWFERKPRLPSEEGLKMAHFLTDANVPLTRVRVATDRQRWRGRNQGASQLQAHCELAPDAAGDLAQPLDTGLDPVCAIAVTLRLAPHSKARLSFATAASSSSPTLRAVVDKYRQAANVKRASLMSATLTSIRLRALRISAETFTAMQTLTTTLVQTLTRVQARRVHPENTVDAVCDRRLLWRLGISGDRPVILVLAGVPQGLGLLRALAQALSLWSWSRLACDLVVVNTEPGSYLMPLQHELATLRDRHQADCGANGDPSSTGFYLIQAHELSRAELRTLHSLARVLLHADGRPLAFHVQELNRLHEQDLLARHETSTAELLLPRSHSQTPANTPAQGQFAADSGEFSFDVSASERPTRPWINVLANPGFGAHISEAGGGYTWAVNSRLNQLTAWSNDPVGDPASEWFLLQDRKTLALWPLTPSASTDLGLRFHVTHGQGVTTISHQREAIDISVSWCVDAQTRVKQITLSLVNHGTRTRQLRLIGMVEWLMGANRSDRGTVRTAAFHQRLPAQQQKLTALLSTQREAMAGFAGGTAFFAMSHATDEPEDWTCDRRECFDARGRLVMPDHFGQHSGDGLDPCAALSTSLNLASGQTITHSFFLGYADGVEAARQLATLATQTTAPQRLDQVRQHWQTLLGATTVKTPDPLFDAMVNHWLLYQTLSCRLWAKAGFYQAGGATGYRDQLQDAMALAWAAPAMLRAQIVLCASRQFVPGDVQHWWHAPLGNGVRTHFSDDLLWLAHACVHYLDATGDTSLLDEPVAFLEGPEIAAGAEDAYYTPTVSVQRASVFEHAARAIDRSLQVGAHGLPLMGSGDWNDGMNRVGIEGRGESVWLGWFLCRLVADFAPLAQQRGEYERAARWQNAAIGWQAALKAEAWDGQWFKRAYFDNGETLGSQHNPEAKIDLIAQAWSVLSHGAPLEQQQMAMAAVEAHLVDLDAGLIKLLDPPLVNAVPSAGYIQAYPPGIRENGGQYAHAGVWALMAQAELAKQTATQGVADTTSAAGDQVYRDFTYLSPAHRASHPRRGPAYGIEPYVMAGDIYSQPPYVGRGGWSWYTGAAAWLHRAAIESMFGLSQRAQTLSFTPCLPSHWSQAELTLVREQRSMRFILIRASTDDALQAAAVPGARLLQIGEALHWPELTGSPCFVIPLPTVARPPGP